MDRIETGAGESATLQLGNFISQLQFEDLPAEVVARTKECILDALGCCLFGVTLPWTRMLLDMIKEQGGSPQASVLGTGDRTSVSQAVLVNSTAGHGFELDDIHVAAHLHAGSLTTPVALALSEWKGKIDGRSFITSMVAGYETGLRVGLAATGSHFMRGYHFQGTCGVFAAAATAARLLKYDAEQARHSLGIAGSQAAGLMAAQEGAMAKRLHAGRAAQSGVYGALLAGRGFTGIANVLEAPYGGFLSSFTDTYQVENLTKGLGTDWELLTVGFKPYASAASTHTAIYALGSLMKENKLKVKDIEEIIVECSTMAHRHCAWPYAPQGVTSAQMSLFYTLSAMAFDGEVLADQFKEARLTDPKLIKFMERIQIKIDPQFDEGGDQSRHKSRVTLVTTDGRRLTHEALLRKGSPDNPLTREERCTKFRRLASAVLPAATLEKIIGAVESLEQAKDVSSLIALLRLPASS